MLYLSGCHAPAKRSVEKPIIAVSILPLQDVVRQLVGEDFEVIVLVPPGVNPETYEPTATQMKAVSNAEFFFQIGLLDFEKNLTAGIQDNALNLKVVDLSRGLPLLESSHAGHASGESPSGYAPDPHVWLSPARMTVMIERITENLCAVFPDSIPCKYERNRQTMISSIDSLDLYINSSFSELQKNQVLIYHPSLTYYAADYGLRQLSVEADGKEPSAVGLRKVVREVRANGINTVFYQKQLSNSTVDALCREAGLTAVPFDPLASDWLANLYALTDEIRKSLSDE
jgi:zinc transport system substrate-binding protein